MKSLTGKTTVDAVMLSAQSTRQGATNAAGATQAQATAAAVTYYKALYAAGLAAGLDVGAELGALKNLGSSI